MTNVSSLKNTTKITNNCFELLHLKSIQLKFIMELSGINEQYLDINMTSSDRSANYTTNDIDNLKKLLYKHSKVILNKQTNGLSIKQKDETWKIIGNEFNASSSIYRSVKQFKSKWEYLKKSARKEAGKLNRLRRQTGGGPPPPPLSLTNEWVAGILQESSSGLDSQYDGDIPCIVVEPPPTPIFAKVNVMDVTTDVVEVQDVDIIENVEQVSTPASSTRRPARKLLNATPQHTRQSFLELAEKKKELVELKYKKIKTMNESSLVLLREEKCRLEMELMRKAFENDEKRKQELHELQVYKMKLEIDILSKKTD